MLNLDKGLATHAGLELHGSQLLVSLPTDNRRPLYRSKRSSWRLGGSTTSYEEWVFSDVESILQTSVRLLYLVKG